MTIATEYALMAGAAYISSRGENNQFPVPEGWSKVINPDSYVSDPYSGFEAISFTNGSEIVISYAGTYDKDVSGDILADVGLLAGTGSTQLTQAAEYFLQIKAANPSLTISLTGHSLGGGLASLIGVFFGVSAATFDQAPFAKTAWFGAPKLIADLTAKRDGSGNRIYSDAELGPLAGYIALKEAVGAPPTLIPNASLISDISVEGEFLSKAPFTTLYNRIGTTTEVIGNVATGASGTDLHSQALLAAFLQSRQTAASGKALNEVTVKLPDLLKMLLDTTLAPKLFAYRTDDGTNQNLVDHMVRHEAGVKGSFAPDAMVTRFTADLWKIAKDGGLTLADGNPTSPQQNFVSKTLMAFAMQMYYEDTANAKNPVKQLFTDIAGGIQFDLTDVSKTFATAFENGEKLKLSDAKGFELYFQNYLAQSTFSAGERQFMVSMLPYMRDWYVQAGASGLAHTDILSRGAFMLGGGGSDALVGGGGADLLVGNAGDDLLTGGTGNDTLLGGLGDDIYLFQSGDGLDTILDSDGRGNIVHEGDTLTGGAQYGDTRVYKSADNKHLYVLAGESTLLIDGQIVVEGYDKGRSDLGLTYSNAFVIDNPVTSNIIQGDLKPIDIDPNQDGDQYDHDELGNVMVGNVTEADRSDHIFDSTGNDQITSGGGNDYIYALRGGADVIEVGAGHDEVYGGDGNDVIVGGADADILSGEGGDDRIYAESQVTVAAAIVAGNTSVGGGQKGDWLAGGAGDDKLVGGNDNDVLSGGGGADLLIGGAGNDDIFGDIDWVPTSKNWSVVDNLGRREFLLVAGEPHPVDYGADVIYAGKGDDHSWAGRGNDVLFGEAGNDTLLGNGDNDILFGGDGEDILIGDGTDYYADVEANMGDDYLDGGADNDHLYGGAGSDILIGGTGDDTLYGGAGQDTYIFNKNDGVDTIFDTKSENNIFRFGAGVNASDITLRLGSLLLDMGNGDEVHIANFNQNDVYNSVTIDSFQFADGTILSSGDLLARGFDLDGAAQDDTLIGTNITDRMNGFGGNDTLLGGGGNDILVGGTGNDVLFGDDITQNLSGYVIDSTTYGKDTLDGGDGNDFLDGGGNDDLLLGGAGDDHLHGGDGDDVLDGGAGSNLLKGGAGNDRYIITTVNATIQTDANTGAVTVDTGIDDDEGQNTLQVDANLTDLWVEAGADGVALRWGDAAVYLQGTSAAGAFRLELPDSSQTTLRRVAGNTMDSVVQTYSVDADDIVYGGKLDDTLVAYGIGSVVSGGLGNDVVELGGANQTFEYTRGDGVDRITGNGSGAVIALQGNYNLADFRLESRLVQMSNEYETWLERRLSVLIGTGPHDRLELGIDDGSLINSRLIDRFTLATGDSDEGASPQALSFGDLVARGVTVIGTDQDDSMSGTDAADMIYALAGNDLVNAGAGDDTVFAGTGSKQLMGGAGTDIYVISTSITEPNTSQIYDSEGASVIRLTNIMDWADVTLLQPSEGTNDLVLSLGSGNTVTVINGLLEAGNFTVELAGGETRSLNFFVAGLDALVVTGGYEGDIVVGSDQGDVLDGAEGDDDLRGGAGNDWLFGGNGQDVLAGGLGEDILFGGEGDDSYVVEADGGNDQVFDYSGANVVHFAAGITPGQITVERPDSSTDIVLRMDANNSVLVRRALEGAVIGYIFSDGTQWSYADLINGLAPAGGQTIAGDDVDNAIEGSSGADLIVGNRGNDVLRGHNGNDEIIGGDDDDYLIGGAGGDVLSGGAGADTYHFSLGDGVDQLSDMEGASTVRFGAGILLGDLNASRVVVGGNNYVRLAYSATDAVLIAEGSEAAGISFVFADGKVMDVDALYAEILLDSQTAAAFTTGDDTIYGYAGNDSLQGGDGSDRIFGSKGDDALDGGAGNDTLEGGAGDDTMEGGAGDDILNGGSGRDTYVMSLGGGRDTLIDIAGGDSLILLAQGDETTLAYARMGPSLLITNAALGASFYIADFYSSSGTWTLKTVAGDEFNLRALATDALLERTAEQRREDFYAALVAGSQSVDLGGGHTFVDTGNRTGVDSVGNEFSYTFERLRKLTQSDEAEIEAFENSFNRTEEVSYIGSVERTRTYQVTETTYTTTTVSSGGRSISIPVPNPGAGAIDLAGGMRIYMGPNSVMLVEEPSTTQTTRIPHTTTTTVTETYQQELYRTVVTGSSVIEDVRGGNQANTITLYGDASKLVSAGGGDDLITRADHGLNDFSGGTTQAPADWVDGGAGNDIIVLGAGNDELSGGLGSDVLDGGAGADTYVVSADDDGWDLIYDRARALVHVELRASSYGRLDEQLASDLSDIMLNFLDNRPVGNTSHLTGYVEATPQNLNELMRIDHARPLRDEPTDDNENLRHLVGQTSLVSSGLDRLIADLNHTPFRIHPSGTWEQKDVPNRPDATFSEVAIPDYLRSVTDTVRFGSGISVSNLQFGWESAEFEEGTKDVLVLSWGGAGGIKVVVPDVGTNFGQGIEMFEFPDGSSLSMQQMLALAPPRSTGYSIVNGAPITAVAVAQDQDWTFSLPSGAFVLTGDKTARYSAALVGSGAGLPSWLIFDAQTGTFTGIPSNEDVGDLEIEVVAYQTSAQVARQTFTLSVTNTNDAPEIVGVVEDFIALTGEAVSWHLPSAVFEDRDEGERLSYRVEGEGGSALPSWLRFNFVTGRLEGTPSGGDTGTFNLQVVATDLAGASVSAGFALTVELDLTIRGTEGDDVLTGTSGTDKMRGREGNDILQGNDGDDQLYGDAGNDQLSGGYGNDILDGGEGDDELSGGYGNDVFLFGRGFGQDVVGEWDDTVGNIDTIRFDSTVAVADIRVTRDYGNLYISIIGTTDRITMPGLFIDNSSGAKNIERVEFADGTVWTAADLVSAASSATEGADYLIGSSGDDTIMALGGNDTVSGGAGNDLLSGGSGDDEISGGIGNDTLEGGAGTDGLYGDAGDDVFVFGRGGGLDFVSDSGGVDTIRFNNTVSVDDIVVTSDGDNLYLRIDGTGDQILLMNWYPEATKVERVEFADGSVWGVGNLAAMASTWGDDVLTGTSGADKMRGREGNDILQGNDGDDSLDGGVGNGLINGGDGNDILSGSAGNELLVGGSGDDEITNGAGSDVIAFNRGDGQDRVTLTANGEITISLGGGITYTDLLFSKTGNDLVLTSGLNEKVTFSDWYINSDTHNIGNLQMVIEETVDYDAESPEELLNKKVQQFNFSGLVAKFDEERALNSSLTSWSLTSSMLDFHLGSSDTAAIGGDLAYQYAKSGNLSDISAAPAQGILAGSSFGNASQALQLASALQDSSPRLL